jgi:hypothetical protein
MKKSNLLQEWTSQPTFLQTRKCTVWELWERCGMGFKPYRAGQAMLCANERIQGDPLNRQNLFHYDEVILNLHFLQSTRYVPLLLPWPVTGLGTLLGQVLGPLSWSMGQYIIIMVNGQLNAQSVLQITGNLVIWFEE